MGPTQRKPRGDRVPKTGAKKSPRFRAKKASTPANFMDTPLVRVERALGDLRRGLPVAVFSGRSAASLCCAAELAREDVLSAMAAWTGADPLLLLTHQRARTLKIRLYTADAVRVPLPADDAVRAARSLADPTRDLHDPLMGPWTALRTALPATSLPAIALAKQAEVLPSVVECAAPVARVRELCARHGIVAVRAEDIAQVESSGQARLSIVARAQLPLAGAERTRVLAFRPEGGGREHLALIIGEPEPPGPVLVRLHSECLTGDLLGSLKCDCGDQLRGAITAIGAHGSGILLYLAQEGRGIGLINKLKAYELQDQGFDTIDANQRLGFEADERRFALAADILGYLGYSSVRLLTNNPDKVGSLQQHGITVVERVAHQFPTNPHNAGYLATKKARAGHMI
jgi:GTP cyclohydrolase II